ncbi:alpha/beta fold hydrolase [Micromonospora sp. CA-259024]|uniref:alpha/beta fold hydrolase n=1 Tax=Micromonospora sp. CA-259024 TaxID=3239965 RepID=UPI003D937AF6
MADIAVRHRTVEVDGITIFYREAGPADAPVVLLPHGYPSSSFQFRHLLPALADRWRAIAPDYPGFGYSDLPDPGRYAYTFDAHTGLLQRFVETLGLTRYVIYLQDYGSQFGLRLAMAAPQRVAGLVIQNGDIYPDQHGPKYEPLKEYWRDPTDEGRARLAAAISEEGFRREFLGELPDRLTDRVSPDLWRLSGALVADPRRRDAWLRLLSDQGSTVAWFPRQQEYLRTHRPPTLIVWGPHDGYMPEGAARAYLRDLPDADLHLLDGGHWLLETHLDEVVRLVRDFLTRVQP